jgi:four helix bundle protein
MDLVEAVYHVTKQFPAEERFGLSAQLRRSAAGIPSNVSEGHQLGTRSYRRFLAIALGCVAECETQLEPAHRLELADRQALKPVMSLATRVAQVLHGLRRSLP